ncbi:MAG TPA: hypothetical protein DEB06_01530, partial [Phycisphaerales bacterium]|nr:hypothetical protein [Phycisphaerales bacterium]
RAYIINEGKVLRDGTPRALINDATVRESYLGSLFRGDEFDNQTRVRSAPPAPASIVRPNAAGARA